MASHICFKKQALNTCKHHFSFFFIFSFCDQLFINMASPDDYLNPWHNPESGTAQSHGHTSQKQAMGESDDKPPIEPSAPQCRICHGRDTSLISACGCRGTCERAHASCLELWIAHRQAGGLSMSEATRCELCQQAFCHRLERTHVCKFLVSRGAWRAWAHVFYLAFCARRVWSAGRSALRALSACRSLGWNRLNTGKPAVASWNKVRITGLLALHYCLLLVLDARLLLAVFRRWRKVTTKVVVCERLSDAHAASDESTS